MPPEQIEQPKQRKKWPWIVGGVVLFIFLAFIGLLFLLYGPNGIYTEKPAEQAPRRDASVQPIPPERFVNNPCGALTEAQLQQLQMVISPPPEGLESKWVECGYDPQNKDGAGLVVVTADWASNKTLDDFYAEKDGFKYFEPTEFAGYPGVYNEVAGHKSDCRLSLATSDQQTLSAYVSGNPEHTQKQTCDFATKVMEAVIETLKNQG